MTSSSEGSGHQQPDCWSTSTTPPTPMDNPSAYSIVEPEDFQRRVVDLLGDYVVWDELRHTIDLIIATNPFGSKADEDGLRTCPALTLKYEVDEAGGRVIYKELN